MEETRTWVCRGCSIPLAGAGHIMIPKGVKGNRGLCLTCADRFMDKYHCRTLHEFMPRYLKERRQETPLKALQEEVRQLRALLDEVTRPNP